ncbi:MAG: PEPxxWA-CTERM sorting domain-containing protein [Sphingomonas sp.]
MRTLLGALALAPLVLAAAPVQAATVLDPVGDYLPTFTGPHQADLDVTSFSVNYDPMTQLFTLGATFAGAIDATLGGNYIIGVNTGTGVNHPFAGLGAPNVIFNQTIAINKNGTGSVGATAIDPSMIAIAGNILTVKVGLGLFPSTGFSPEQYGFNLWPRFNGQIPDFAPDNATLAAAVPEPATWGMLLLGFGAGGAMLRRRQRTRVAFG